MVFWRCSFAPPLRWVTSVGYQPISLSFCLPCSPEGKNKGATAFVAKKVDKFCLRQEKNKGAKNKEFLLILSVFMESELPLNSEETLSEGRCHRHTLAEVSKT
jgi:hypothetical protein